MNLNSPRIVPVEKLSEADIDRLLDERRADLEAAAQRAARTLPADAVADLQRERPVMPRRRESIVEPVLNVLAILAGYTAAHWRVWLAPVTAIGLIAWWCFR